MKAVEYKPIGVIHSPFKDIKGVPIQPTGAVGVTGTAEIEPMYGDGLKDIEGFSHIILIYHCIPDPVYLFIDSCQCCISQD